MLQRKHYRRTSRKVLHEAFGLDLKLAFLKQKGTVSSISTSLNEKVDGIRTKKALWRFVQNLILKVSNLAIIS